MLKLRTVSSTLVALLVASVLAGCGGGNVEPVSAPATTTSDAQPTPDQVAESAKAADVAAEASKAAETTKAAAAEAARVAKNVAKAEALAAANVRAAAAQTDAAAAPEAQAPAIEAPQAPAFVCPSGTMTVALKDVSIDPAVPANFRVVAHGSLTNTTTEGVEIYLAEPPQALALDRDGNELAGAYHGSFDYVSTDGRPKPDHIVLDAGQSINFTLDDPQVAFIKEGRIAKWFGGGYFRAYWNLLIGPDTCPSPRSR